MKHNAFLMIVLAVLLTVILPVAADEERENPSLYSFAEIAHKLPKMWGANQIEVAEMMAEYRDFVCWRGMESLGCESVNNNNCRSIYISHEYSGQGDYAEYDQVVFSIEVNNSEDVQEIIELLWLDGMAPANIQGFSYDDAAVTLYFSIEDTMEKYSIYFDDSGNPWLVRVEFGYIRG